MLGLNCHASQVCFSHSTCPHSRPLLTHAFTGDTQTLKGRSGSASWSLGPGAHKVLVEPLEHLWWLWDLILNAISPLQLSCWGFSFALGCGYIFLVGSVILLSMVVQQLVAILEVSQEKMSTHPSTSPSCSRPGSSFHGILQARILEWVAIPFSRGSSQPRHQTQVSNIASRFFTI